MEIKTIKDLERDIVLEIVRIDREFELTSNDTPRKNALNIAKSNYYIALSTLKSATK